MDCELPMIMEGTDAGASVSSLSEALRDHQSMVFSIALHSLRDRALAEDIAQEVFFRLSTRLHTLHSREIAGILEESVHTIKSRLQRGLAMLRTGLERKGVAL